MVWETENKQNEENAQGRMTDRGLANKHLAKAEHLFVGWMFLNHLTPTVVKSAGIRLSVLLFLLNSTCAI